MDYNLSDNIPIGDTSKAPWNEEDEIIDLEVCMELSAVLPVSVPKNSDLDSYEIMERARSQFDFPDENMSEDWILTDIFIN